MPPSLYAPSLLLRAFVGFRCFVLRCCGCGGIGRALSTTIPSVSVTKLAESERWVEAMISDRDHLEAVMDKQEHKTIQDQKAVTPGRSTYIPPKVQASPLDEIVKAGFTFSSDGDGPGKT